MKRKLTLLLVSALLIFSTTLAQTDKIKKTGGFARLSSIGANLFVADPFNITLNPAWGAVYNDFIFVDIGSTSQAFQAGGFGQFFAGSFSLNKSVTIGAILSRNDFNGIGISLVDPGTNISNVVGVPFAGVVSTINSGAFGTVVTPLDNNIELFGTYKIKGTTIGFGAAYASRTSETTPPSPAVASEGSATQIGFNAGVLQYFSKKFLLDAGVSLILPSASYTPPTTGASDAEASQTIILATVRGFYKYNKKVSFVPLVTFLTISGSGESGGTASTSFDLPSVTLIGFGIGVNYHVGNFLLAGGPSLSSITLTTPEVENVSPELSSSAFLFPIWNIGLEWNMLDWLVGRLGYVAISGSVTLETDADGGGSGLDITEIVAPLVMPAQRGITAGIGFRFGDFSLDALVNEDILRQGLNNIGGTPGGATFAYLSASYVLP